MNQIRLYNLLIAYYLFHNFTIALKLFIFLIIAISTLKICDLLPKIKILAIRLIIYPIYQSFYFSK